MYILRGFKKLVIAFFPVKNTLKLINQQLKNWVKIVNWKKKRRERTEWIVKENSGKKKVRAEWKGKRE